MTREPGSRDGMHSRAFVTLIVIALSTLATSGCVENMEELKDALGFRDPPAPDPVYLPPTAKAKVNVTSALVSEPLRFMSEGSRDPQGLPLTFTWRFPDNQTQVGAVVTYTFLLPGEYTVTLNVTNDKGLGDEDNVTVTITQRNRAPTASFVARLNGTNITSAEVADKIAFNASGSSDLDGDKLSHLWTFGDGSTSIEAAPTHSFAEPGLYTVRLKVDDGKLSDEASRIIAINGTLDVDGQFTLGDSAPKTHKYPVAEGARQLLVRVTFEASFGASDLTLVVRDANGTEVARTTNETGAGTQGTQTRELAFAAEILSRHPAGSWSFDVVRTQGVQVSYHLHARETF